MNQKHLPVHRHEKKSLMVPERMEYPIVSLQREINRMFDSFFLGTDLWSWAPELEIESFSPGVDVMETENEFRITADLPGMDEKDIHVSLAQNTLTIKGEKKEQTEEKAKTYHRMERSWGSFYRAIPLPQGIDASKADAVIKKGQLTVTLPKTVDAKREQKEIPVHQ